jgi:hypothetical protein
MHPTAEMLKLVQMNMLLRQLPESKGYDWLQRSTVVTKDERMAGPLERCRH